MNDLSAAPIGSGPSSDDAKQLRMLVHACAISLLILIGTFFAYLYRQTTTVRKSTSELVHYISEYEQSKASEVIGELQNQLDAFRRQHPDFDPIYTRYFGTNPPPPRPAPAPAEAGSKVIPAPGAPPSN